jgi:integrase/recombinase XerC
VLDHHAKHIMPLFARGDGNDDLLFRKEDGDAIDKHYISYRFSQYREAAGLSAKCTPHGLRRMYATQLALAQVDIYFIMSQLGHSSIAVTMRYIKLPRDFIARMVREAQRRMVDV